METKTNELLRGGQFLVKETKAKDVFTPEDFSEEQKMMRDSVKEFEIVRSGHLKSVLSSMIMRLRKK